MSFGVRSLNLAHRMPPVDSTSLIPKGTRALRQSHSGTIEFFPLTKSGWQCKLVGALKTRDAFSATMQRRTNMDQVESFLERPKLYYNIDGVGELRMGFMCLGFALLLWLQVHTPQDAIWHRVYVVLPYVGMMVMAIHYGSKAIKAHVTYPRTGFVEYRKRSRSTVALGLGAGALFSLGWSIALRSQWDSATPACLIGGLLFAACYAYGFDKAVPWKWIVACALVLHALVIAFLPANFFGAIADDSWVTHPARTKLVGAFLLSLMIYGTIFLISGSISFWLYLRHTQAPAQESQ
jgi:hypothetical protein